MANVEGRVEQAEDSHGRSNEGNLKEIFDLCDRDRDGYITAHDFRSIGKEHFGNTQQIDSLIQKMDPDSSGHISFSKFLQGVETYLSEYQRLQSTSSSNWSLSTGEEAGPRDDSDGAFSSDDVYPVNPLFLSYLSHGYTETNASHGTAPVELVVDPPEDGFTREQPLHSSPTSTSESPTLVARNLIRRHNQLTLPESPSQGSTPAELADEEVTKLSDQLHDLTSKLEDLQEDQKDSEEYRQRLKKENSGLRIRLEECEEQVRHYEHINELVRNESKEKLKTEMSKARREYEVQIQELKNELSASTEELSRTRETEATLRSQLSYSQQEVEKRESSLSEAEEMRKSISEELRRTREQLKAERDKWEQEKDGFKQEVDSRDHHVHQLQVECDDIKHEKNQLSIASSDMEREINRLKKELEQAKKRNEDLESKFIQHGQALLANSKPQSLAVEMETASKDEVVKALHDTEETNARLHVYIEGLLANIIEHHPELLERR